MKNPATLPCSIDELFNILPPPPPAKSALNTAPHKRLSASSNSAAENPLITTTVTPEITPLASAEIIPVVNPSISPEINKPLNVIANEAKVSVTKQTKRLSPRNWILIGAVLATLITIGVVWHRRNKKMRKTN